MTMTADEEKREIIRLREKAIMDDRSRMDHAMEMGEAKGRAMERAAMVAAMCEEGLSEETIKSVLKRIDII